MKHAPAPLAYSKAYQDEANRAAELADMGNHKRGRDVEIGPARLVLTSPDGTRWSVTVDNAGALSATAI